MTRNRHSFSSERMSHDSYCIYQTRDLKSGPSKGLDTKTDRCKVAWQECYTVPFSDECKEHELSMGFGTSNVGHLRFPEVNARIVRIILNRILKNGIKGCGML